LGQPPDIPGPVDVDPLKALFDKVFSAVLLSLSVPLTALIALAIKLDGLIWSADSGSVFYSETRISAGESFRLLKFRTMRISAIREIRQHGSTTKYLERESRGYTRVGRILQRWYLDELPQLLNVLRGDMSFVGPRPPAPFEYERELSEGNVRKSLARAGLVGLQQVNKGRTKSFEEEIALDYEYIARVGGMRPPRRLVYEMGIILRSIRVLLEGRGL
jgi:lipopolysaccharide/colanic/teichoic acid biosynthesis glycosyltransferase